MKAKTNAKINQLSTFTQCVICGDTQRPKSRKKNLEGLTLPVTYSIVCDEHDDIIKKGLLILVVTTDLANPIPNKTGKVEVVTKDFFTTFFTVPKPLGNPVFFIDEGTYDTLLYVRYGSTPYLKTNFEK